MKTASKKYASPVLAFLGCVCVLLWALTVFVGVGKLNSDIPQSADSVAQASPADGAWLNESGDLRFTVKPCTVLSSSTGKTLGIFKTKKFFYCYGWILDGDRQAYHCMICVYEGTDLYTRIQQMKDAPDKVPDLTVSGYFSVGELAYKPQKLQNRYREDVAACNDALGGSGMTDSGRVLTYLGTTPEEYVANKTQTAKREWKIGLIGSTVVFLPIAVICFVLMFFVMKGKRTDPQPAPEAEAAPDAPPAV